MNGKSTNLENLIKNKYMDYEDRKVLDTYFEDKGLMKTVTDLYFKPKFFEKNGTIWKYCGAKLVQKAVMGTVGKIFRKAGGDATPTNYFIGYKRNLENMAFYEKGTRFSEAIHVFAGSMFVPGLIESISKGDPYDIALNGGFFLFNAGLVVLQRYNRARVYEIFKKRNKQRQDALTYTVDSPKTTELLQKNLS